MQKIKSKLLIEKINNIRKIDINNFQSNYFLAPIDNECISFQNENAIIFLSKEKSFYKLFYAFNNISSFKNLLSKLPNKEIYLEIISKAPISDELNNVLKDFFEYKTTYQKLYKKLEPIDPKTPVTSKTDADLIFEKLYSTFNIYFEHLMSKDELTALIKENKVITVYENNEMKSFLIYKKQGTKAYLNQIANYGSKENLITLWKLFYQELNYQEIKYLDLWYDKRNKKAENMYNIEQFQPLNMFNFCYKKL